MGHDLNRFGFLVVYGAEPSRKTAKWLLGLINDGLAKNAGQTAIGLDYPEPKNFALAVLENVKLQYIGEHEASTSCRTASCLNCSAKRDHTIPVMSIPQTDETYST